MKKVLVVLGGIFLSLIIIAVIGIAVFAVKGNALDEESKAYVEEVIPIILSDLNRETLFKYSSPELINSAPLEKHDKMIRWLAKLGKYERLIEATGQGGTHYSPQTGKIIAAHYQVCVEYDTGPATVTVHLVKRNSKWMIYNFNINSEAFIDE